MVDYTQRNGGMMIKFRAIVLFGRSLAREAASGEA
jgi:hypothetical protein